MPTSSHLVSATMMGHGLKWVTDDEERNWTSHVWILQIGTKDIVALLDLHIKQVGQGVE